MNLAPDFMNEVSDIIECPYPLRNELGFTSQNNRTVMYGIETIAYVGSSIWSYMPNELKESTSINKFRLKKKLGNHKTARPNSVKSTFQESVSYRLLISFCS